MTDIDNELATAKWKKSKRNEHEYVLELDYPELVHKVQALIKAEGIYEKYKKWNYKYWGHKGWKYWVMPGIRGLPRTLVLNRVRKWCSLRSFIEDP